MLFPIGLILLSLALLAGGGELLVRGATSLARLAGLTPSVIGLTVVAMGTSLPELSVSVVAALRHQPDLAVANVVGSNIFNITVILGLSALVRPLPILGNAVKLEWPVMFLASLLGLIAARDGQIDRLEAGVFVVTLAIFTSYTVWLARQEVSQSEAVALAGVATERSLRPPAGDLTLALGAIAAGIALLVYGGRYLVDGAVQLARIGGVSERVIGLTIVAGGTSVPEVAASLVAAARKRADIAVANLIGSNIFNLLGILGVAGLIGPLSVSREILRGDFWWMIGTAGLILPLMRVQMRLSRLDGAILLATYGAYLVVLLR